MRIPSGLHTVDFETHAIGPRPDHYPPEPVGVAIRYPSGTVRYLSWGHPTGNNTSREAATSLLAQIWTRYPLAFHNAQFDISVAHERLGLPYPPTQNVYDSLWAAFFADPYSPSLSLKPLAERHLGLPPNEQDAVREWLVDNKVVSKALKNGWGAHICDAPGTVVAPYAKGDVDRTAKLLRKLYGRGVASVAPYRREQRILPLLLENSELGVPLDAALLRKDIPRFETIAADTETEIFRGLSRGKRFNLDSNDDLADAIEHRYKVKLPLTPKSGERQVNKAALAAALPPGRTKALLLYRSALVQSLQTFLRPWLEQTKVGTGNLHTQWNSVRGGSERKKNAGGARTGRLSSEPNLQNMTTEQEDLIELLTPILGAVELPIVRSYIKAPKGFVLVGADYSQQELRMLAHFEGGVLAEAYRADPELQVHKFVQQLIKDKTGIDVVYRRTKTLNFAIVYGAGLVGLAAQLGCTEDEAWRLKEAYFTALPSVRYLINSVKAVGRAGDCLTTLGGRHYYSEPARMINDERRTFEYKLVNYWIQGSSADQTKEGMANYHEAPKPSRFLLSAHDEVLTLCPRADVKRGIKVLTDALMETLPMDVPTSLDVEVGTRWSAMKGVSA